MPSKLIYYQCRELWCLEADKNDLESAKRALEADLAAVID